MRRSHRIKTNHKKMEIEYCGVIKSKALFTGILTRNMPVKKQKSASTNPFN